MDWTREDDIAAKKDGWLIASCSDPDHAPYEIEYLAEPDLVEEEYSCTVLNRFTEDNQAWDHVVSMAEGGSDLHRRALLFIHDNSPQEWADIQRWTAYHIVVE